MKIVTVQFNYGGNQPDYLKLLKVFKYSVKIHMPNVDFIEIKTDPPENRTDRQLNYNYNDFKLKKWLEIMEEADDNIIFADCDMLALRNAEHGFDENIKFDVAYTQRTVVHRIPMNGGIVFARPTKAAKNFFREWYKINNKMLHDRKLHVPYQNRWAGMNQAAFGYMFTKCKHGAKLHQYKTRIWNAVDCDWNYIDSNTVFLHIKSKLRKIALGKIQPYGKYIKPYKLWKAVEEKMKKKRVA